MNLPNYFLADLPVEAALTPAMITEACHTLKRNREQYLVSRPTDQIIQILSELAAKWLEPGYPFRELALEKGPPATGFSRATLRRGLETCFEQFTPDNLTALLAQELGHVRRLDDFSATTAEQRSGRAAMARGPELLGHLAAGNIPNPTFMSMVLGLLVRSAQFVKCARGTSLLPRLFAHSLYEAEPKLASCLEIAEWPGGTIPLETALFEETDCVTATGSDETLLALRQRLPMRTRFLGYGHRLSFGFVSAEALANAGAAKGIAARSAADIVAWDQLGCLSPHVVYAQAGGVVSPEIFAAMLADSLAHLETLEPRGDLPIEQSAIIQSKRDFYQVRAAASTGTQLWHSANSTAWTVVFEADPGFQASCLNRFIYVKSVASLEELLRHAESVRRKVSTVGIAALRHQIPDVAWRLARWGVTRVCPLGHMQQPPLTWRHDGRPALGDLVVWTDLEANQEF